MRLVYLRYVTCYTDQNLKSQCSFRSSKSRYLGKKKTRFKESYRTSVNLEDLDVDSFFQHFVSQRRWRRNRSTQLRRRKSTGRDSGRFVEEKRVIPSTGMITNIPANKLIRHLQCCFFFFSKTNERQIDKTRQGIYYHNITSTIFWHAVSKKTLVEACQINFITNQILYYIISYHIISYHIISYHIISYYIIHLMSDPKGNS